MPDNLPGGCMVQCVRHFVLPRLKKRRWPAVFLPVVHLFPAPQSRGFFLPRRQEIKDG
ncbi:pyrBI operon leader peptide [Escherichia sp. E4385]|uniref:pyrBI operon leader peptide n=1 Tax=Escherichia sp. E4385 TaxID=2040639 RepID=UPI0030DA3818